jgi:AraC-like DNA-binding protein
MVGAVAGGGVLSGRLAITRAAHLLDYIAVMREVGAPIERELSKSQLPPSVEETPDHYIVVAVALEWVARCGRDVEPMELGFLAARKASLTSLKPSHSAEIMVAQTCLRRLEAFFRISVLEDSCLLTGFRVEGDRVRVFCDNADMGRHPFVCMAEWLNLQTVISVLRSFAGASWSPREMCFVSRQAPSAVVLDAFPDTRILVGQPHTSILIDRMDLARSTGAPAALPDDPSDWPWPDEGPGGRTGAWSFADLLGRIIQPHLAGGAPDLAFAAEMMGMSKRTMQRRLLQEGVRWSDVLQEARFGLARALLAEPNAKIIDVAMTAGYENPQHFTRSFRRFTGVTPSVYRRALTEGAR